MTDSHKLDLLKRVHDAVLDPKLFDSLSASHREEISQLLDEHELEFTAEEEERLNEHPEGVERLYGFLAESRPATPAECAALELALARKASDEESLGSLFKNGLCRDLGELEDPTGYFKRAGVAPAGDDLIAVLESRIDVQSAQPAIGPFLQFGMTPMSVYRTCDAPRTLALRQKLTDTLILVERASRRPRPGEVPAIEIAREAASLEDGAAPYYHALLEWLIDVHRADPLTRQYLFRGFSTVVEGDELRLTPHGGDSGAAEIDLELHWQPGALVCA